MKHELFWRVAFCAALPLAGVDRALGQSGELVAASGVATNLGPNLHTESVFQSAAGGIVIPGSGGLGLLTAALDAGPPYSGLFRVGGAAGPVAFAGTGSGTPLPLGPTDLAYGGYFFTAGGSTDSSIAVGQSAIAFKAISGSGAVGLWFNDSSVNTAGALKNVPPPLGPIDPPCVTFDYEVSPWRSNPEGNLVVVANCIVQGGGTRGAVWILDSGQWRLRILLGSDGAFGPGLGSGSVFGASTSFHDIALSHDGTIYIIAETNTGFRGIWRSTQLGNQPVALSSVTDKHGPGLGPSVTFANFRTGFSLSRDGARIGYIAQLQGGTVVSGNNLGVFVYDGASNAIQARTGTTGVLGPGTGSTDIFSKFEAYAGSSAPLDLSTTQIAFFGEASTTVGIRRGAWISTDPGSRALAMTNTDGPLGPQAGAGVTFSAIRDIALLNNGEVVIDAVTSAQAPNEGLWNLSLYRTPVTVFRTGGIVDVDPGVGFSPRIIQSASRSASFGSRGGGWPANIADDGFAIYPVTFAGSPTESGLVRVHVGVSILADGFE